MLAVKRVFALNDAAVIGFPARLRFGNERGKHRIIRDSRIFQGQILPAGSLMADGAGCNDQIPGPNGRVDAAAGADTQKRVHADGSQLFHTDGGARPADAG